MMYRPRNGSGKIKSSNNNAISNQRNPNTPIFGTPQLLNGRSSRVTPTKSLVELEEAIASSQILKRNSRSRISSGRNRKNRGKVKFFHHECFRYVEGKKLGTCGCGLPKEKHPPGFFNSNNESDMKWTSEKCTRRLPTNAFGEIDFTDEVHSDNKRKPYVRVSHKTDPRLLLNEMQKEWRLNIPNLVISVTGGAKSFSIKPRIKEAFSKGLIKVAVSTNAWIITGGTNAGVMKHVGEAVSNRGSVDGKINVLGIAPWGVLQNSDSLISRDGKPCKPAEYSFDSSDPARTGLDVNHTHFFLVDNGTTGQYGTEIELRSRLEETIAKDIKTSSNSTSGAIGIPVVILCLEGGPNTIKTMAEAIKHNTPAVVIDNTGRAADVVCFAYNHLVTDENCMSTIDEQYEEEVKERVADVFGNNLMEEVYENIKSLLRDTTMITVVRIDESGHCDMDLAILRALLKANKGNSKIKARNMIENIRKSKTSKGIRPTDVVYDAFQHLKVDDNGNPMLNQQFDSEFQMKTKSVFGNLWKSVYKRIVELLKNQERVNEFRLFDKKQQSIYEPALLNVLLTEIAEMEVKKATFKAQLKLALAWNRIDVAESEIFTEELKGGQYKSEWLYESMFVALSNNKPDFVELFLNEGLNLKHFLTLERLENLFNEIPPSSEIFGYAAELELDLKTINMGGVAQILEELMGDRFTSRYKEEPYYMNIAGSSIVQKEKPSSEERLERNNKKSLPNPFLDLFTWAVLCNRKELALLIWKRSRNSIAAAVMASRLLKTLADKISDNKELADMVDELLDHAGTYEFLAVGVLDECRKEKDDLAQTLVVKELTDLGGLTTLDIAVSANNQNFVAHPTCQTLLSRLWMGALYVNTSFWRVLLCVFCPFLINAVIMFREDAEACVVDEKEISEDDVNVAANPYTEADEEEYELSSSLQASKDSLSYARMSNNNGIQGNHHSTLDPPVIIAHDNHSIFNHFDDENSESVNAAMGNSAPTSSLHRILHFYDAPFVKFVTNVMSYLFFLLMYSTIICARFEMNIHPAEYVLHGWVVTLITEEIRQFVTQEPKGFVKKLEFYFSDPWNIADTISLGVFVVAAVLRYVANYRNDETMLTASRVLFATDVVMFFIRLLQIFLVNRHMGPKIVMIRRMLMDLGYFVIIMAVIIVAYGVAQQAVLYPNTRNLWSAFVGVVNRPYWQMYGELFYEDIIEDKLNATTGIRLCGEPGSDEPCPDEVGRVIVPLYLALYMLFTNILLLNLLIAIFNYTFEKVQEDSDKVWKFGRYHLISEYHDRPPFFPPLIIIPHVYMLLHWFADKCCCKVKSKKGSSLKMTLEAEEKEPLELWEYGIMEMYCFESTKKEAERQDVRVKNILNRVNNLSEDMVNMRYGESALALRPTTRHGGRPNVSINNTPGMDIRLSKLEKNVEYILELMINQTQRKGPDRYIKSVKLNDSTDGETGGVIGIQKKNLITTLHAKARIPMYPSTTINRFKVSDGKVPWEVTFTEYNPVKYTAPFVLAGPYWADVDLMEMLDRPKLAYNKYDEECKVNRESHTGTYSVVDSLPRNPFGRTGIIGRGSLGRFGPNHAADPIATRWKRSSSGIEMDKGKRILEFIAIMRKDNCQWAIPGGMVEPGQNVSETLRKEFTEEALAKLDMSEEKRRQLSARINHLFNNGKDVYKGYVDDPRNTDNAWMETVACNFHDESGNIFGEFELKAGDDAQAVRWQRVSGNIPLFASHVGILKEVAKMHDAAFY